MATRGQEAAVGTVLVVDDEPMLRDIAKAALTRIGYMVLVAKDGFEAVEIFQRHRESIGCVLCDFIMPGMDGWETLSALRRLSPDLPVILSSGYDPVQAMAGDHPDLPQFFLGKPYDLATLDEVVRQAFTESGKK
jgi:CheY-like chemotaxis protein